MSAAQRRPAEDFESDFDNAGTFGRSGVEHKFSAAT